MIAPTRVDLHLCSFIFVVLDRSGSARIQVLPPFAHGIIRALPYFLLSSCPPPIQSPAPHVARVQKRLCLTAPVDSASHIFLFSLSSFLENRTKDPQSLLSIFHLYSKIRIGKLELHSLCLFCAPGYSISFSSTSFSLCIHENGMYFVKNRKIQCTSDPRNFLRTLESQFWSWKSRIYVSQIK